MKYILIKDSVGLAETDLTGNELIRHAKKFDSGVDNLELAVITLKMNGYKVFVQEGSKMEYAKGGKTDSNLLMVKNQAKELLHHSNELISVLKKNPHVEAWVVAKIERATTDLSDVTHYLDGMFAKGGMMAKGGMTKYGDVIYEVIKDSNGYRIIDKYDLGDEKKNFKAYIEKKVNRKPYIDTNNWRLSMILYNLQGFKKDNLFEFIPNEKLDLIYDKYAEGGRINYSEYYKMGGKVQSCEKFDENGERKIDLKSIKELTECVNKLPQTKDFYFVNGEYTPERKRLHKQIIYNIKKDLVCVQNDKPIAILMGGSPASGKSTFLKKYRPYLLEEEILKVDADDIRSKLPEYEGYNATQTHLETKDIVNLLLSDRNIGIPCKFDLIYDGTMNSTKSYLPLIDLLKSLGYKIFVVYIDKVPKEVVIKRALERYKKSGRFVPLEVIEDFFDKGKSALNEVKTKVDGYMVIDGSNTDYNVIEKGGMQLPKTRLYSKIGEQIKVTPDKVIKDYKLGGNLHD